MPVKKPWSSAPGDFVIALDQLAQANLAQEEAENAVKLLLNNFSTDQLEDIYNICGQIIRDRLV